jgi:DNA-binding transcriptional ArsR family regulator
VVKNEASAGAGISWLRATAHPLRLQMLSLLTGAEMSAADVARELGVTHANASYHLRLLAEAGLLQHAGEVRIRGGVARRYRHRWEDETLTASSGSGEDAERYVAVMAEQLVRRYRRRKPAAGKGNLTDAELWVTPEVHERVHALLIEAAHLLHREASPPRTPGTVAVAMTAALFVVEGGEPPEPGGDR